MDQPDPNDPALLQRLRDAAAILAEVARDRTLLLSLPDAERDRLLQSAGHVYCPDVQARRRLVRARSKQRRAQQREEDQQLLDETGIRKLRRQPVFTTPNLEPPADDQQPAAADDATGRPHTEPRTCYICKRGYTEVHTFYDQLCPPCADLNWHKRGELTDLRGTVALLTGGRVKIGYQAGIKLLRCGVKLIVSTRFPRDAAVRYAAEPDFEQWRDRLVIHGLDLRHTPSVEAFCRHLLATESRLDFVINNACQTVRRPPAFYEHMMARETGTLQQLPQTAQSLLGPYEGLRTYHMLPEAPHGTAAALAGLTHAAELSQVPLTEEDRLAAAHLFPQGLLDQDLQQVDLRERNSWRLLAHEVSAVELLEVQLINAIAPFLLNARLKPLMLRAPGRGKHIVNVSAVEGQFYRRWKTTRHPHTNMAKAALNMLTRTAAADYVQDGIHMNAVDTGWVTDEDPLQLASRKRQEHAFHPPLDIVDGAARIVDPIIHGHATGEHLWGKFLKDYMPADW